MAQRHIAVVLEYLRGFVGTKVAEELSDGDLLERFAGHRDEAAFAALMERHAAMVFGVCQRLLHEPHEAEDAFQAAFLILARRAVALDKRGSVGPWLYTVAYHVALRARRQVQRWRRSDREVEDMPVPAEALAAEWRELRPILDEEVNRLPARYRAPVVLCYFEGRTVDQAAERLLWPRGTVAGRLARAKELLRTRLTRRGVTLATGILGHTLAHQASAAAPLALREATLRAAVGLASGIGAAGVVTAKVLTLADGTLRAMSFHKVLLMTAACVLTGTIGAVAGVFVYGSSPALPTALAQPDAAVSRSAKASAPQKVEDQAAGFDSLGDPLPPGALVRLGTSRLRGVRCFFLPDGRRLVRERSDGALQIFEVPSGKRLALMLATDVPQRQYIIGSTIGFSPDGKYLAAVCWEGRCGIWDTASGRLVRWLESGGFFSIVQCDFSPDGKLLAVGDRASGQRNDDITVGVYEVESGRKLFAAVGTNSVFAQDGKSLVTWQGYREQANSQARRVAIPSGQELAKFSYKQHHSDQAPQSDGRWFFEVGDDRAVRVRDVATGEVKHTLATGGDKDAVVYLRHKPGRRELIVVSTRPAEMRCYDVETGNELWHVPLAAMATFPALSADGNTLVAGDKAGIVHVWDAATGKERLSFRPGVIGSNTSVAVSFDGDIIATNCGNYLGTTAVAIWDAANGKLLSDLPGHAAGIGAAAFAADGSMLHTIGEDHALRTWNAVTGKELNRATSETTGYLVLSPDGKSLYTAEPKDGTVSILHTQTGRVERTFLAFTKKLAGLALTADGKQLVAAGRDGEDEKNYVVRFFDAATGAKLREFGGADAKIEQLAASADGKLVATSHLGRRVFLWDANGKKVLELLGQGQRRGINQGDTPFGIGSIRLAPDGRWLAYSDQENGVAIVDTRTGRETGRAKLNVYYQQDAARDELHDVLAFSPDGKTIAWSGVESTADIFLIEVCTGKVRRRLKGDSYPVQRLVFSPDGSKLLTAGPDGSALIWDVFGQTASTTKADAPQDLETLWAALADDDAMKAYRAIWQLVAMPEQAVGTLKTHLKPTPPVDEERYRQLVKNLDSDQFADRTKAAEELEALGDAALPLMRQTLKGQPSLEARRRLEAILAKSEGPIASPEPLRTLRAIEVLERMGTPEARQLLTKLADGAAAARVTQDAKASQERLSKRN